MSTNRRTSSSRPINVAIPNTTAEKMRAIASLADTVGHLARALNSTNVQCNISNNVIRGAKGSAISIASE